jgi:hypothetical protein
MSTLLSWIAQTLGADQRATIPFDAMTTKSKDDRCVDNSLTNSGGFAPVFPGLYVVFL